MGRAVKRLSLTAWIFIGLAAGIALGVATPGVARELGPASNIFLRLIKSIIAPLLFGTLVYGIAGTGSIRQMGRIGLKAIVYFEIVTTIALFLGLAAVNLVRPGEGLRLERSAAEIALPK
jgi:proton glutamate symport protein